MSTEPDLSLPREAYASREDVQFLDVRGPDEWEEGRIEGAVHVPLQSLLAGRLEGIDKERPVVAYCSHGNRSQVAKLLLQARGFEAYNLDGGLEAWEGQGLPLSED